MRRTLIASSIVTVGLLLTACSGGPASNSGSAGSGAETASSIEASSAASASTPAPVGYEVLIVDGKITTAKICEVYTTFLTKYVSDANALLKSGSKAVNDPYAASNYIEKASWANGDASEKFAAAMSKSAAAALNIVSDGQAGTVGSLDAYLADSIDACGLTTAYTTAKTKAGALATLVADLNAEAENVPWYPKGYDDYSSDESLAWKWTDESCGYSSGYCWTMRVISRDGCYSGLYGEINIEQNDVVIDYTNDVIGSLGAGKTAKLSFVHFDSGQGTLSAVLTELNCRS